MYAWEVPFVKMISETRAAEIKQIQKSAYLKAYMAGTSIIIERLILFVTLISFSLMGQPLSAEIVFVLATYYNLLQLAITIAIPQTLLIIGESLVSIKRIKVSLHNPFKSETSSLSLPKFGNWNENW